MILRTEKETEKNWVNGRQTFGDGVPLEYELTPGVVDAYQLTVRVDPASVSCARPNIQFRTSRVWMKMCQVINWTKLPIAKK